MAGWGLLNNYTFPNVLQTGSLVILSREICEQRVARLARRFIPGDERTVCSIANPYVISRPVSYNLYTDVTNKNIPNDT
jgi:hypothetical protein